MIEVELTGTLTAEYNHESHTDERDQSVTVESDHRVEGVKAFHDGYVNLEGYALSQHWADEEHILAAFTLADNPAFADADGVRPHGTLTVQMHGDTDDWIQQGVLYVTERPDDSLVGVLQQFRSWDETDDDTLNEAIRKVRREVEYAERQVGDMTHDEYNGMVWALDTACGNHDMQQYLAEPAEQ